MSTTLYKIVRRRRRLQRRGNILMLSAILMVMMAAFVAFGVELGTLCMARGEMQRAADACALSAAWDLIDYNAVKGTSNLDTLRNTARQTAYNYASWNKVLNHSLSVPSSDVEFGYMADPTDSTATFNTSSPNPPNAVRIKVRKSSIANNPVAFGFARVLGIFSKDLEASATAALITDIKGFKTPGDGQNLDILPIALDDTTWDALMAGTGTDNWNWNNSTKTLSAGSDGIKEVNLYPIGNGSPGNRGTVDIGSSNNSTADLSRQIVHGITPQDLSYLGGELKFNSAGKLYLNGDTGISAGIKDDLASIIGQTRLIPIFTQVTGPGNNATYTIVKFVGIRVLAVKLTGSQSSKHLTIQPAAVVARGAIASTTPGPSKFAYSPPWLVK